jgi:Domain of unknown function (DUF5665)
MNIFKRKEKEDDIELKDDVHYQKEILHELKKIKIALDGGNSFKRKFLMGIVGGFGTVVGATVVVSLLILVLNQFAQFQILEPLVRNIIEIVDRTK